MFGSAKTNFPLLTLTSWVKGTSSFSWSNICWRRWFMVYDEEMMKVLFVDIFGQNISDCTNRICLSLLKPESFKTKFDYYLLSMIVKHSQDSQNETRPLHMTHSFSFLYNFIGSQKLRNETLQLFSFAWEHTFCPSASLVHHMKEVKEGSLGNWIFVKSPFLLLRPTPDSLCRFSAASPLQDS